MPGLHGPLPLAGVVRGTTCHPEERWTEALSLPTVRFERGYWPPRPSLHHPHDDLSYMSCLLESGVGVFSLVEREKAVDLRL